METVYSAIGVALVIAVALIIVILIFKDSIRKRIESGATFESSFGPSGAKLLLGSSANSSSSAQSATPEPPQVPQAQNAPPLDAKLIPFIPPLPNRFKTLEFIRRQPPKLYEWPYVPTGLMVVHDIPFVLEPIVDESRKLIGHHAIDILPNKDNAATVEEIPAQVSQVSKVHFLLSAGNGWVSWEGIQFFGKRIGYIELVFTNGNTQKVDLILGKHIREWYYGWNPNLVRNVDYNLVKPAWVSHDNTHRIDFMSVSIEGGPKDLKTMRVVAKFEDEYPDRLVNYPAIVISAVTCESKQ